MNVHEIARLTFARRMELVRYVLKRRLTPGAAAFSYGVKVPSVRKWVGHYLPEGDAGLRDRSSRPKSSPRAIAASRALGIVELRRRHLTQARIAASLEASKSTVRWMPARAELSRLRDLEPSEPAVCYEHEHLGDLLHIDTKQLGRIERMSQRITGDRRDTVEGAGSEFLFVAIDDHARIGFTDLYPNERKDNAAQFLENTVAYFRSLGVRVRRVLTDNGSAFRSSPLAQSCRRLGLKQSLTRPYRPQTNGKAERFIQSVLR